MGIIKKFFSWCWYHRIYLTEYMYIKSGISSSKAGPPDIYFDTYKYLKSEKGKKMLSELEKIKNNS